MQAIILATATGDAPKPAALIEVGGRPLIEYAWSFARAAGAQRVIVVGGGPEFAALEDRVADLNQRIICVDDPDWAGGDLSSLMVSFAHRDPDESCLVTRVDHIYEPALAAVVAELASNATDITAFCDLDREASARAEIGVRLTGDSHLYKAAPNLREPDAAYAGMTFVPAARTYLHRAVSTTVAATAGDQATAVGVLGELAQNHRPPAIADISGYGWIAITSAERRERAEHLLATESWW